MGTATGGPAPVPEGTYRVRNVGSGLLLEVYKGSRRGGAKVQQGAAKGGAGQHWRVSAVPNGGGLYHLVNAESEKRLDVVNASTEPGALVQQWRPNNFGAQEWIIEQDLASPGTVALVSFISGLLLEVAEGSDEGADVRQGEDTDSPYQWWRLEPVGS
ncbi:RICIN domain-containing protein [Streptomyces griseus]|uniref:RICIN domain-containing protein n=1 Tax=Streptomyces griseus TaxID=1911 RepID=UPI0004C5831A|nr:RICIN domain-containing protein [Streptomyces griseus]